jgi:hypothetical protein
MAVDSCQTIGRGKGKGLLGYKLMKREKAGEPMVFSHGGQNFLPVEVLHGFCLCH